MEFFLKLDNRFNDGKFVKDVVVEADGLGFHGFLMSDHYMWQTREPNDVTTLETWVTLTYLAGKTEQIRLGTQFTPIPFRHPAIFAKMLSTLDVLSNGRVILGVGAGWSQAEFEGYSEWGSPKVRVSRISSSRHRYHRPRSRYRRSPRGSFRVPSVCDRFCGG